MAWFNEYSRMKTRTRKERNVKVDFRNDKTFSKEDEKRIYTNNKMLEFDILNVHLTVVDVIK